MMKWLLSALLILVLAPPAPTATSAAAAPLCFPQVPGITHCIAGRLRTFWEQNGGLAVFGYPITAAGPVNPGGPAGSAPAALVAQTFQRNRLEVHPENAAPYDVLLGRLGVDRLAATGHDPAHLPRAAGAQPGCLWFAQTGHNVCDQEAGVGFQTYWRAHGLQDPALPAFQQSVALFGLPLTEAHPEPVAGGGLVLTQWFERARFEYHPANAREYRVLLGLLGTEAATAPPVPAFSTGLVGLVTIGPNCGGPDTGDPLCESKPYQATIAVLTANRAAVQQVASDAQGQFQVALPPGTYILVPQSAGPYPHASEQTVTVVAGQITPVHIDYDTGIR